MARKSAKESARSTRRNTPLDREYGALLVRKTLCRQPKYNHMLTTADIYTLEPHFKLLLESDDSFHVVSSGVQLGKMLDDYENRGRKGVMSLVLRVGPIHWATLVVSGIRLFFTDSLNQAMDPEYTEVLEERPELHVDDFSLKQQNDEHNCGFWALMNAEAIRRQIHDCSSSSVCFPCVLPSVGPKWQGAVFRELRRNMARKIRQRDMYNDESSVVEKDEDGSSSSSSEAASTTQETTSVGNGLPSTEQSTDSSSSSSEANEAPSRKRKSARNDRETDTPKNKKKKKVKAESTADDDDDD